jgi:CRISPR/Cas system-associated protein endoribonuclease Cas2
MLFDYTKAMASYDSTKKLMNNLEETLPYAGAIDEVNITNIYMYNCK